MNEASTKSKVTLRCPFCLTLNAVALGKWGDRPKCGDCAKPLLLDRPIKVSGEDFDRTVLGSEAPVLVDFYADWCIECKHLERQTFRHASVQAALRDVVLLRADVTANDAADRELLQRFQLFGPPAVLFFDSSGAELRDNRLLGFVGPADFAAHLEELQ